jgi:hypothetical protein
MLLGAFFEFQFNLKIKITKLPLNSIFTKLAFIGFFFFIMVLFLLLTSRLGGKSVFKKY